VTLKTTSTRLQGSIALEFLSRISITSGGAFSGKGSIQLARIWLLQTLSKVSIYSALASLFFAKAILQIG
jgi:hypothetical protein